MIVLLVVYYVNIIDGEMFEVLNLFEFFDFICVDSIEELYVKV